MSFRCSNPIQTVHVIANKLDDVYLNSSGNSLPLLSRDRQLSSFHGNQFLTAMFSKIRFMVLFVLYHWLSNSFLHKTGII